MSKYTAELGTILVKEFFGPATASVVDVLLSRGRLDLRTIARQSNLPLRVVSEVLTVLIQHGLVRWATVEDGSGERTYYECFFEDVYPLIRLGKEVQLTEKHAGSESASLVQYIMMQGHQRIKDIIAALTDKTDIDHDIRVKQLNTTLKKLWNEQYLRTISWWNLMPPDDLSSKINLEEEKRVRGEMTTSASMTTKLVKEAGEAARRRLDALKQDDRNQTSLKRKAAEKIDMKTLRKRRRIEEDSADDEEEVTFDFDENITLSVDHRKFAMLERNAELVWEVRKRLGPATASVYEVALQKAQEKLKSKGEDLVEINVMTSDVAIGLPDFSKSPAFLDLVEPTAPAESHIPLTNGTSKLKKFGRRIGYSSDDDELPEVKINGIHRNEDEIERKMALVAEHLTALADDSTLFIRSANGTSEPKIKDDEQWTINLLSLQQFIRRNELEKIIERKYGADAIRLIKLIEEKTHIDQDQFEKSVLLRKDSLRPILSKLQSGGILEVQEIAKSTTLERAKNYNLWSFHESRARAFILEDLYKTIIRIYQRIDEERSRKQGIITKAQRTDVKKDLKRYLSADELRQYAQWKTIEERLLGQIVRVDRSVMILRDM